MHSLNEKMAAINYILYISHEEIVNINVSLKKYFFKGNSSSQVIGIKLLQLTFEEEC